MKYVIMADGKGSRWNNYMGHGKHDITIGGETLLQRTVRLLHLCDDAAEVIITSHNEGLSIDGAVRYEPKNNVLEIDRFTAELIGDDMCFLYGDVYYSEKAIETVVENAGRQPLLFVGSEKSICAVLIKDGALFKSLYEKIRGMFLDGKLSECKGIGRVHALFRVDGEIAQPHDVGELAPCVVVHRIAEGSLMDERHEIVLVGHIHGVVGSIDPLHRQLQSLPAAYGAHGRRGVVDTLRLYRRRAKHSVFIFLCQKAKIRHDKCSSD